MKTVEMLAWSDYRGHTTQQHGRDYVIAREARRHLLQMELDRNNLKRALEQANRQRDLEYSKLKLKATDRFDPHGHFVYLLWGDDLKTPVYVGRTSNLFARPGKHLNDHRKKDEIKSISVIRCESEGESVVVEAELIRKHQPKLNVVGTPRFAEQAREVQARRVAAA